MAERHPGATPGSRKTYAIYYGWLTEDEEGEPNESARRIAAARIPLLIAQTWTAEPQRHLNLSAAVLSMMRDAGTKVFAYVATNCGNALRRRVDAETSEYLATGVDGIFFDEADPLRENGKLDYYKGLARLVQDSGKRVILNPGVAQCGECIMDVADYLMVEHRWRDLRTGSLWSARYAADRFMGVSSNEGNAMGYVVDEQRAIDDTHEAWRREVGWHTSTDRYVQVPAWFERYVSAVNTYTSMGDEHGR